MTEMTSDKLIADLKLMRRCSDAYCEDHDCKHCKIAVEQDERLEVLDLVIPVMENILNRNGLCPLNNLKPCVRSCAWYDSVKECCIMRRI